MLGNDQINGYRFNGVRGFFGKTVKTVTNAGVGVGTRIAGEALAAITPGGEIAKKAVEYGLPAASQGFTAVFGKRAENAVANKKGKSGYIPLEKAVDEESGNVDSNIHNNANSDEDAHSDEYISSVNQSVQPNIKSYNGIDFLKDAMQFAITAGVDVGLMIGANALIPGGGILYKVATIGGPALLTAVAGEGYSEIEQKHVEKREAVNFGPGK